MRRLLLIPLLCGACIIPTHRGLSAQRSRVWAAPGSPTVFSWVSTVEHRKNTVLELRKNDSEVVHEESDEAARTTIYAFDPATQQETRLGQLDGGGGTPIYYDAARDVLWVRGDNHSNYGDNSALVGMTRSGNPVSGPQHQHPLDVPALEPPFVIAGDRTGVALYDLRHDGSVPIPGDLSKTEIRVTGDIVRITEVSRLDDTVHVHQITVDWSSGQPIRAPDLDWTTSPLPPSVGLRVATTVLSDDRHYAEVVRDTTSTRLLVYDLLGSPGAVPVQITLPAPGDPELTSAHLVALPGDAVVFGEAHDSGEDRCWRGAIVRVDQQLVQPIPYDPCVIESRDVGADHVLVVKDVGTTIVGPDAKLITLSGIEPSDLAKGKVTGPTTRVFSHDDGELEQVDLATGERKVLVHADPNDHLLAIEGNSVRYARSTDRVVTFPIDKTGSPSVVALGVPELTREDRMPRDRTELWLGVSGGAGTQGTGVGGLDVEIAHWVSDHWTWVARGILRFSGEDTADKSSTFDGGGTFGYAWHRLPRLFSLSLEADVGAAFAGTYVDKKRTDAAFAPSLEVHIGWQGKMLGFDVSAVVPSFIDIDRGVLFLGNAKIGFTENLH
ncbi:MAG TPA: hypothetical protein VL326_37165 [Kofleriaceae bacterium]|nr:hypothetical protein [Kofleriaceae bacterium]